MARSEKIVVSARPDGEKGIFATRDVAENEILINYDGPVIDHATRHSIQIDDDKHIEGTENSNAFLNHSCDPTAYVDWNGPSLRARRMVLSGEEITCNYFTTDYDLCEKFTCKCGSPRLQGGDQRIQISYSGRAVGTRALVAGFSQAETAGWLIPRQRIAE